MITAQVLRELIDFDPDVGVFIWLKTCGSRGVSGRKMFGCSNGRGHLDIRIMGKKYKAHRLAWLHYYGRWPDGFIDHVNGDGEDNRICNLRECSQSQNMANARKRSDNKSGFKGVCWSSNARKWMAYINESGKRRHIGYFPEKEDAAAAYAREAERCFGSFARID